METTTPTLKGESENRLFVIFKYLVRSCPLAHLKVCVFIVECNVDGEGRGVVMGPQVGLSLRRVFHHKVHDGVSLQAHSESTCSGIESVGKEGLTLRIALRALVSPSCSSQRRPLT